MTWSGFDYFVRCLFYILRLFSLRFFIRDGTLFGLRSVFYMIFNFIELRALINFNMCVVLTVLFDV
jgi:hypothetical protein